MKRKVTTITITDPSTTKMIIHVVELSSPFFFSLQFKKSIDIELYATDYIRHLNQDRNLLNNCKRVFQV